MSLLEVHDIHTFYGKIHALKGISIKVEQGQIVTLIGSNGAGKSTTLNTICGITPAAEGKILLDGQDITRVPAHQIVTRGVIQSPEGRKIFTRLTVRENLEMGAFTRNDKAEIARDMDFVFTRLPRLKERIWQLGGTLSGGEQQMLAIGRALMARPRILLLDEPSMGLAPLLVEEIFNIIKGINEQGVTILLVEQNALMALEIANQGYVLQSGEVKLADDADKLLDNDEVRKLYLGEV
ncbi:MAG TPA: ABC transporter ATP-binding protein [Aggregatilineales bacterium]|nr:ABC transporter ATP-binding protein [Aggregatilineales bacterium]